MLTDEPHRIRNSLESFSTSPMNSWRASEKKSSFLTMLGYSSIIRTYLSFVDLLLISCSRPWTVMLTEASVPRTLEANLEMLVSREPLVAEKYTPLRPLMNSFSRVVFPTRLLPYTGTISNLLLS